MLEVLTRLAMCTLYQLSQDCTLLTGSQTPEGEWNSSCDTHVIPLTYSLVIGLTNYTSKAHLCRATLEAVAFQSREVSLHLNFQ